MDNDFWVYIEQVRTTEPHRRESWALSDVRWLERSLSSVRAGMFAVVNGHGLDILADALKRHRAVLDKIEAKFSAIDGSGVCRKTPTR